MRMDALCSRPLPLGHLSTPSSVDSTSPGPHHLSPLALSSFTSRTRQRRLQRSAESPTRTDGRSIHVGVDFASSDFKGKPRTATASQPAKRSGHNRRQHSS